MRFSVAALAKVLSAKSSKRPKFKVRLMKKAKTPRTSGMEALSRLKGLGNPTNAETAKSTPPPPPAASSTSRIEATVDILQGLAKESQEQPKIMTATPPPAATTPVVDSHQDLRQYLSQTIKAQQTTRSSRLKPQNKRLSSRPLQLEADVPQTPTNANDFIRLMEARKTKSDVTPTPPPAPARPQASSHSFATSSGGSEKFEYVLKRILSASNKATPAAKEATNSHSAAPSASAVSSALSSSNATKAAVDSHNVTKPISSSSGKDSSATITASRVLNGDAPLPPMPPKRPASSQATKTSEAVASSSKGKYDFLKAFKTPAPAAGAGETTTALPQSVSTPKPGVPPSALKIHSHQHQTQQPPKPTPSHSPHRTATMTTTNTTAGQQKSGPKKSSNVALDTIRWITDSLPHPTSHKSTISLTLSELRPISSAVEKRWNLYGKIRELHSSGRFSELIDEIESQVANAAGDLRAVVSDTAIVDLILDAYFSSQRYGDVIRLFNAVRSPSHQQQSGQNDAVHPRVRISVTSYCIAIESVLKFAPKESGAAMAISMYQDCLKNYEPTPQLVMSFFRGCDVLDPDSESIQKFALEEFRRIAVEHQFSTMDVKGVVEAALNGKCAKLGRTNLDTDDVFEAISPILSGTHSDAYKKTLHGVLPAIVRKLNVSSIKFLERMRKAYPMFHPGSDLIDGCVDAELTRPGHNPLELYKSLLMTLKHPKSTQSSTYLRWVRNDCVQRLAVDLADAGHHQEARSALTHLLSSHQHVTLKTFYAILSTFLQRENLTEAQAVASSLRSAYANPDPSTWNLLVRVNLGRSEVAEAEVERRMQSALAVFGQMVEAINKIESTDESFEFAHKTVEKTVQDLVDWAVQRKSSSALQKIIETVQSLNLVQSEALASAKQLVRTL